MRRRPARSSPEPDPDPDMDRADPIKLQARPNLFSSRSPKSSPKSPRLNLLLALIFALLLILVFYSFYPRNSRKRFRIVIDGGSTGTRIHVFEYEIRNGGPVYDFSEKGLVSMRVNPGLSSYAEDPDGAGGSLGELVEFGRKRVPETLWAETEVRLMATAGLRLLDLEVQDRILEACRKVLRRSGFKFHDEWASVISGSDEGVYAWIVANYALGTLGGDPQVTTGIIELGGASAQVTFVSNEPVPPEFSRTVKIGNFTYNLYSHSLLHFGQNVAFESMLELLIARGQNFESIENGKLMDPCVPRGYTHNFTLGKLSSSSSIEKIKYLSALHANGNFSECRSSSLKLLQNGQEKCPYKRCDIGSTFIPRLQGKFLATENFYFTSKFFHLESRAFLSELKMAGERFCEADWSTLKKKYHLLDEEDIHHYCFSSAYIVALLHDSLGFALDDERIAFANQVKNIPLDWALGAFILLTSVELDGERSYGIIRYLISEGSSTLLVIFILAIVLTCVIYFVSKWRKPQVKTIYDLEKGKYIVKRIGRYS